MQPTVSLLKLDVPLYLQDSYFFESLSDEKGETFTLNQEHFKPERHIGSIEELKHALSTIRFWGVRTCPKQLLEFAWAQGARECEAVFSDYWNELTYLRALANIMNAPKGSQMDIALESNNTEIINFLLEKECVFTKHSPAIAARKGNLSVLLVMHERKNEQDKKVLCEVALLSAAKYGQLHILQAFLVEPVLFSFLGKLYVVAAESGHLACLRYLWTFQTLTDHSSVDSAARAASRGGHLACLDFIAQCCGDDVDWFGCQEVAAAANQPACLEFSVHKRNGQWAPNVELYLTRSTCTECLDTALRLGLSFSEAALLEAIQRDNLPVVQWLLAHNIPPTPHHLSIAASYNSLAVLQCLYAACTIAESLVLDLMVHAARGKNLNCLKFLCETAPGQLSVRVCNAAVGSNTIECLTYLHSRGYPWDETTSSAAHTIGSSECFWYLVHHGCPVTWWQRLTFESSEARADRIRKREADQKFWRENRDYGH